MNKDRFGNNAELAHNAGEFIMNATKYYLKANRANKDAAAVAFARAAIAASVALVFDVLGDERAPEAISELVNEALIAAKREREKMDQENLE